MTTIKEPTDQAMLAARLARAYPALSPYSAASLAVELCRIERAQRRHAERCCSGEDGGYVTWFGSKLVHDPNKQDREARRVQTSCTKWIGQVCARAVVAFDDGPQVTLQGDPRGPVLLVRLPSEPEAQAV